MYPTSPRPATLIKPDGVPAPTDSPTNLANESGFPNLIVPAGMTPDGLPVTISFFGQAFSEAKLRGYGYDFDQATKALAFAEVDARTGERSVCADWPKQGALMITEADRLPFA